MKPVSNNSSWKALNDELSFILLKVLGGHELKQSYKCVERTLDIRHVLLQAKYKQNT